MNYYGVDLQGLDIREHYNVYALNERDAAEKAKKKFIKYRVKKGIIIQDDEIKILRIRNIKGEIVYFNKEEK